MTAERFQAIEREGGCVDLTDRAKFRLTGRDRVRFLNGQVTNDVRTANARDTLYACVTDIKGRVCGDVFIHAAPDGEALFLDAEPPLREALGARLERYIIADDVELADVSDEWKLRHVFGPAAPSVGHGAWGENAVGARCLKANRIGCEGIDVWVPAVNPPPGAVPPVLSADEFETLRIVCGVPRFPSELNTDTFPPEAGLDARAMSYTKGCYIGQEILSRIRTTGRMPRELVRWQATGKDMTVEPGDALFSPCAADQQIIGMVTSVAWHPALERRVGLAFLRQGFAGADSELPAGSDAPRIAARVKISPVLKQ